MRSRRGILPAFLLVVSVATTSGPAPTQAAPSTCGTAAHYWNGYAQHPSANFINGIDVVLKLRTWGNCTSSGFHADSEWVMIHPDQPNPPDENGWAQVGYEHDTNNLYSFFWQTNDGTSGQGGAWGSPSVGDQDSFTVDRASVPGCSSPSGYCLIMKLNGNRCHQENGQSVCMVTNFDPHNKWGSGTMSTASGEVPFPGDDMAGYVSSKTHWTHLQEKDGESWTTLSLLGVGPSCPYYKKSVNTLASFDTWTDPSNHNSGCS